MTMAQLEISGFDELSAVFARMANDMPDPVVSEALTGMAAVAAVKIRASGEAMGVRDPESDQHILDKIKVGKPKITRGGGYVDVRFAGSRKDGPSSKTSNTAIAFENEFGNRRQTPRPFVRDAMARNEDTIIRPAANTIGDWMEKEYSK